MKDDGHQMEYSQITEQIFIGSDLCDGPVCPLHTDDFKKLGVCAEINLELEHPELPPKNIDSYLWLPVPDEQAPTQDQLFIGSALMQQLIDLKNIVYVHCKNGHGRSPTLVAAYLIRYQHKTVSEALDIICAKRPKVHLEEVQIKALEKFQQSL